MSEHCFLHNVQIPDAAELPFAVPEPAPFGDSDPWFETSGIDPELVDPKLFVLDPESDPLVFEPRLCEIPELAECDALDVLLDDSFASRAESASLPEGGVAAFCEALAPALVDCDAVLVATVMPSAKTPKAAIVFTPAPIARRRDGL